MSVISYLCSVGASKAELNDEDGLGGDDSVRGGVGRRSDHRVCAALSCPHSKTRIKFNMIFTTLLYLWSVGRSYTTQYGLIWSTKKSILVTYKLQANIA